VKIGDFGSAYRSKLDRELNQGEIQETSFIEEKTALKESKKFFVTLSYLGPEKFLAYHDVKIDIDEYKNDIHSLGIVFLYIQEPGIKIKGINELIMAKTK
jgi:serine/threonine protein kinase